jgi:hypothetical protein
MTERCFGSAAAVLCVAACGGGVALDAAAPDVPSAMCASSAECGAGNWCNPLGTICEPRGTTYRFESDIFTVLGDECAGCHVAGVRDPQGTGNIAVFAGGPDVAYASLVEGGTSCSSGPHRICVEEPVSSRAVARLLTHAGATSGQPLLLPAGIADPWMQKLLHWIAAGARRGETAADAGTADAPLAADAGVDAPLAPDGRADARPVDARPIDARPIDARVDAPAIDAPPPPDGAPSPPGAPVITEPDDGDTTAAGEIEVTWTAAAANGSAITRYDVTARRVSTGATTTVTCGAPFSSPPCRINADQSLSATVGGLSNCTAYDVRVTATNAGGSTTSAPREDVTPVSPPSTPTLPSSALTKVPGVVGELSFTWNAASANGCGTVSYTVELTPPPGFLCGNPADSPCQLDAGTATDFVMSTTVPACPYPSVDCDTPRRWAFRVRATNQGGASGFSSSRSSTPRVGYRRDLVWSIWSAQLAGGSTCVGCHSSSNVLDLGDGGDPEHTPSYGDIVNTANVVILSPSPSPGSSLLHVCPTDIPGCNTASGATSHAGGKLYDSGSREDNLVVQWILDGALF